ncbi:MAG: hypothetical protein OSB62_00080 [Alphaproteobacteria bacterium]|nr:hypothetical protein [Alphaproteobacteria bacterium]
MLNDNIDWSSLPANPKAAFVVFEKRLRQALTKESEIDRSQSGNVGNYGEYLGNYLPERMYAKGLQGFISANKLDIDLPDVFTSKNEKSFSFLFDEFRADLEYVLIHLAVQTMGKNPEVLPVYLSIASSYKQDIADLLNTIRGIVNQEVVDANKKDMIFRKMNALQSEVDRDKTTLDVLFGRVKDVNSIVKECAPNVGPLVKKVTRLYELVFGGAEKEAEALSAPEELKKIENQTEESAA